MKNLFRGLCILLVAFVLTACGSSDDSAAVSVESVEASASALILLVDGAYDLDVTVLPSDASQEVTWYTSDAAVVSVNQTGVVTGVAAGIATVSVASDENEIVADLVPVVVYETIADIPDVTLTAEVTTANLTIGETVTVDVTLSVVTVTQDVTWFSSNESVATVSDAGVITGIGLGTTIVRATWTEDSSVLVDIAVIVTSEDVSEEESEEDVAERIAGYEDAADAALEDGDFSAAIRQFELILVDEPNHATANFMKGFGALIEVVEDDSVQDVVEFWEDVLGEESGVPEEAAFILSSSEEAFVNPIQIIEGVLRLQGYSAQQESHIDAIDESVIPILERANEALEHIVDLDPVFDFSATVTRSDSSTEVDLGDIYTLLSMSNTLEFLLKFLLAYDWDAADGDYPGGIAQVFSENEDFGTLRSVGEDYMADAMVALGKAVEYSFEAVAHTKAETDDQSDDILKKEDLDGISVAIDGDNYALTDDKGRTYVINDLDDLFSDSNYSFEYINRDGETKSLVINLGNFFNSPIEDFRDYFGIDGAVSLGEDAFPSDFDYTFSGLFPEFTSYDLMNEHGLLSSENGITYFVPTVFTTWGAYYETGIGSVGDYLLGPNVSEGYIYVWESDADNNEFTKLSISPDYNYFFAGNSTDAFLEAGSDFFHVSLSSSPVATKIDLSEIESSSSLRGMAVEGDSLFLLVNKEVYVYDISTPESPVFDVSVDVSTEVTNSTSYSGITINDGVFYIVSASGSTGYVHSFDIESDNTLTLLDTLTISDLDAFGWGAFEADTIGDLLVSSPKGNIVGVDISNPSSLSLSYSRAYGYDYSAVPRFAVSSDKIYVSYYHDETAHIDVLDAEFELEGTFRSGVITEGDYTSGTSVDLVGDRLYIHVDGVLYSKQL